MAHKFATRYGHHGQRATVHREPATTGAPFVGPLLAHNNPPLAAGGAGTGEQS